MEITSNVRGSIGDFENAQARNFFLFLDETGLAIIACNVVY